MYKTQHLPNTTGSKLVDVTNDFSKIKIIRYWMCKSLIFKFLVDVPNKPIYL